MKFLNYLSEEFFDSIKSYPTSNELCSIFMNPSTKDLIELRKETNNIMLRFLVEVDKKNLYVFSNDLLHAYFISKYNIKGRRIFGEGRHKQGKIEPTDLYLSGYEESNELVDWNLDWCKRYFTTNIWKTIDKFLADNDPDYVSQKIHNFIKNLK